MRLSYTATAHLLVLGYIGQVTNRYYRKQERRTGCTLRRPCFGGFVGAGTTVPAQPLASGQQRSNPMQQCESHYVISPETTIKAFEFNAFVHFMTRGLRRGLFSIAQPDLDRISMEGGAPLMAPGSPPDCPGYPLAPYGLKCRTYLSQVRYPR